MSPSVLNWEDSFCMLKVFSFIYLTSVPENLGVEYHISRFIVCVNSKVNRSLNGYICSHGVDVE